MSAPGKVDHRPASKKVDTDGEAIQPDAANDHADDALQGAILDCDSRAKIDGHNRVDSLPKVRSRLRSGEASLSWTFGFARSSMLTFEMKQSASISR